MQPAGADLGTPRGEQTGETTPGVQLIAWLQLSRVWVIKRRLVLITGFVAAMPVFASLIRAVIDGWVPIDDRAVIATRSYDVLTVHSPLLGQVSNFAQGAHSLGPLLYWLLAIPARFTNPIVLAILIGLVNAAAVMGVVALAHRRGGHPLMFASAMAVAVMSGSLSSETLHDIWNPSAGLLPFTCLIFLCWSVACGEYRLLPVTILAASFAMQCHLMFVLPTTVMLMVSVAGLVTARRRLRRHNSAERLVEYDVGEGERRSMRRWVLGAVAVGLVCWSAPLIEQVVHRPGNLVLVIRAARAGHVTLGSTAGWHAVVRAVGVTPWWLRGPLSVTNRFFEVVGMQSPPAVWSCSLLLAGVVLCAALGARRRRLDVATAGALSLGLCLALGFATASTPSAGIQPFTIGYTTVWGSPAGMWVWLTVSWSVITLFGLVRSGRHPVPAFASQIALSATAATAALVAFGGSSDPERGEYQAVRTITSRLDRALPRPGPVRVDASPSAIDYDLQPAVVYALRRQGVVPLFQSAGPPAVGNSYELDNHRYDHVLSLEMGDQPPPQGGRVIVRVHVSSPGAKAVTLTVALSGAPHG